MREALREAALRRFVADGYDATGIADTAFRRQKGTH